MTENPFDEFPTEIKFYDYIPIGEVRYLKVTIDAWREKWEPVIIEALEKAEKHDDVRSRLEAVNDILSDPQSQCDTCEAMKCYGALYPICEPTVEKLKMIINSSL